MKKFFSLAAIAAVILFAACNEATQESGTHTHEDGSTHTDHDTTRPPQQEFVVGDTTVKAVDSTKEHTHADGEKHSH